MYTNNLARGRSVRYAFTLIELLVVISIIGLLTGLIVAGAMKFKEAGVTAAADNQASILQKKLREDYSFVVQQCHREPLPKAILDHCGGDRDRALAVHTAATLRTHFPETFVEATTGTFNINGFVYRPKSTFASVAGASGSDAEQRAALLYLILKERAVAGGTGDEGGTTGEVRVAKMGNKDLSIFIDPHGSPVVFYRWAQNAELNDAPYTAPSAGGNKDPLDPKGLVANWTEPAPANTTKRDYLRSSNTDGTLPNLVFNSSNRVPTVVSAGKNKTLDTLGAAGTDDRVGYRLDRFGAKGDKK